MLKGKKNDWHAGFFCLSLSPSSYLLLPPRSSVASSRRSPRRCSRRRRRSRPRAPPFLTTTERPLERTATTTPTTSGGDARRRKKKRGRKSALLAADAFGAPVAREVSTALTKKRRRPAAELPCRWWVEQRCLEQRFRNCETKKREWRGGRQREGEKKN